MRALARRPGCSACIVADATLYAAEHCEQLLGAPEIVISHCKAALPSTVGEVAACVGQPLPCCAGRGAACAAAAAVWVAKHVGGHRDDIAALRAELELEASQQGAADADADADGGADADADGSADADADGSEARGAAGAAEAGAAEARSGELSARLEARLEAGRRRLVGLRARQLARLLGLPPPAEAAPAFATERAIEASGVAGAAGVAGAIGPVGPTFATEVAEAEEVAPCGSWVWPWLAELSSTEPRLSGMTEAVAEMEAQVEPRQVGGARAALPELLLRMSGGEEVPALDS